MKRFLFLSVLLIFVLSSCKKNPDTDPGSDLTGMWTTNRIEESPEYPNWRIGFDLKDDFTAPAYSFPSGEIVRDPAYFTGNTLTYTLENDVLSIGGNGFNVFFEASESQISSGVLYGLYGSVTNTLEGPVIVLSRWD